MMTQFEYTGTLRNGSAALLLAGALTLAGCSGSGSGGGAHTVGGTVSGLTSSGLVLQNNGGDDTAVAGTSFRFATALADGAAYAVTVKSDPAAEYCGVTNGSGTVQGAAVDDVAITCRGWRDAQLLETDEANDAHAAQVAVDAAGNAIAVWHQSDGSRDSIWANRYVAGSGWGGPQLIEDDNTGSAVYPRIAMDSAGNAFVVWRRSVASHTDIMANRYTAGVGWGTAQFVETDNTGHALEPQIAIDATGAGTAIWRQSDGSRYVVYTSVYDAGTGWSAPAVIDGGSGSAMSPQLMFRADGDAVAVWAQTDGANYSIWSNQYSGGSWGTPQLVETDDAGHAYNPQLAPLADGSVLAVWQQWDGSNYSIFASRHTAAGGWGVATVIEAGGDGDANDPQLVADGVGDAIAVWSQVAGGRYRIWRNHYAAGSGWGTAQPFEAGVTGNAYLPQLAVDGGGNFMTVWAQDGGSADSGVWTNRYASGTGWGRARRIEGDGADSPHLAAGGDGTVAAVWERQDAVSSNWDIRSSRFE